MLERCINLTVKLGVKQIFINSFHLSDQIFQFVKNKKFPIDIQIIKEENEILDTGGGILNLINHSEENDFIIFNPDTLWHKNYLKKL